MPNDRNPFCTGRVRPGARNVVDAGQARLVRTAEIAGIPFRRRVRTAAGRLTAIGVPPAVAHRTVRNGNRTERFEVIGRGTPDGSLPAEMADAVGKGVTLVEQRVDLDDTQRQMLVRRLVVHETPGDVATAARREAIRLGAAIDDPERVPVAEDASLNETSLTIVEDGRVTSILSGSDPPDPRRSVAARHAGRPDRWGSVGQQYRW
ncbi:hypothetical protein [Gordonia liuliyuniae]|uniref:UTRA domain-containing protein n=1 Tax=Gordonia liuliyuniae TaxID=2911517 RepID=A0ABS9IY06_9ACTN|nr:hypothetical protein [Gordonia liuliyuniae]MCF8590464.1 hypothetical protein [Gordonia liuliyuniae]